MLRRLRPRLPPAAARCRRGVASQQGESPLQTAFKMNDDEAELRYRTQKNPIIPNVANLPKRWEQLDAGKQDDLVAYLEDRMRGDWREISNEEKRAIWFIYYGPWGPRSAQQSDQGGIYAGFAGVVAAMLAGVVGYKLLQPTRSLDTEEAPAN